MKNEEFEILLGSLANLTTFQKMELKKELDSMKEICVTGLKIYDLVSQEELSLLLSIDEPRKFN